VAGAGDVERVEVAFLDRPVQVRVQQVEPGRRAPMAQQPWFDVLGQQRLAQKWVVQEVDLADRQIIRRPPVGVDQLKFVTVVGAFWLDLEIGHG
jgi:hypothetical protein